MSVRFAPARKAVPRIGHHAARRGLIAPALARAANDNGSPVSVAAAFDPVLKEALRHFAVHGLASAQAAMEAAEDARRRGDGEAKEHWVAVTAMFDRRLAATSAAPMPTD